MARQYGNDRYQSSGNNFTAKQILDMLEDIREQFEETVKTEGSTLQFNSEKVFFAHKLIQSPSLCKICGNNPEALKNAFLSVAATGLTMDPTQKLAWIIPQKGSVVYDISYRGMIRAAVDSDIISDAVVDLVFANDSFRSNGLRASPTHEYDPFCTKGSLIMNSEDRGVVGERGVFRGAYVDYRLPDGSTLVHFVPKDEIAAVRDVSNSWKNKDKRNESPWATFPWAMVRKSIVRSGNNILPIRSNKVDRLVHLLDQNEGYEPLVGDVAATIAGEPTTSNRQGLMVQSEPTQHEPTQTTPETPAVTSNSQQPKGSKQKATPTAQQSNPSPQQSAQSTPDKTASELTPVLVKRLENIAKRAAASKNFSAAYQHINETYSGESLAHVTGLVNKARHEYASGLIQRANVPGVYQEVFDFVGTLPDGAFKDNFLPKIQEAVHKHVTDLIEEAQRGNDADAIEYLEHMPDGDIKTALSSSLYELA